MELTFEIDKRERLQFVKEETYVSAEAGKYFNNSAAEVSRMTRTQAGDEDEYLLASYMDSAAAVLADVMDGSLKTIAEDKYVFNCLVPETYDKTQDASIKEAIKSYLAAYTLYRWYKRVDPKMADPSEFEAIKSDLNHRINQRLRPVRRSVLPLNF